MLQHPRRAARCRNDPRRACGRQEVKGASARAPANAYIRPAAYRWTAARTGSARFVRYSRVLYALKSGRTPSTRVERTGSTGHNALLEAVKRRAPRWATELGGLQLIGNAQGSPCWRGLLPGGRSSKAYGPENSARAFTVRVGRRWLAHNKHGANRGSSAGERPVSRYFEEYPSRPRSRQAATSRVPGHSAAYTDNSGHKRGYDTAGRKAGCARLAWSQLGRQDGG